MANGIQKVSDFSVELDESHTDPKATPTVTASVSAQSSAATMNSTQFSTGTIHFAQPSTVSAHSTDSAMASTDAVSLPDPTVVATQLRATVSKIKIKTI